MTLFRDGVDSPGIITRVLSGIRSLLAEIVAVAVLVTAGVVAASVGGAATANAEPAPPRDSFYDRPSNLASLAPGDVIRIRNVNIKTLQIFPAAVDAWQLAYRTTDAEQKPDMTVTTVMVPRSKRPTKLLSYQAATDSTLRICNPSYSLTHGTFPIDPLNPAGPVMFTLPSVEMAAMALGINEGWAVAVSDHGGVDARFLTPRQPGYAVLDGIRAVQNFPQSGITTTSPVAMWGYSGGAIATSWAIEEQPTYAPELTTIKGAAMGAPERDLAASLKSVNTTPLAGLIPIALSSISKDSPSFAKALDRYLTPDGRRRVSETRNHCIGQNAVANLWFDYRHAVNAPIDKVLNDPDIASAIAARGVSGRIPRIPSYVYNGVTEEVAPIVGTDKLVASYCAGGASVTYRREELPPNPIPQISSTHGIVILTGLGGALNWVEGRMNGDVAVPSGCDIRTVPSTGLDPAALQMLGPGVGTILATLAGVPIGR